MKQKNAGFDGVQLKTQQSPTFAETRDASQNGKVRLGGTVQGRYFTYRGRTFRGRSTIDFDLHPGNRGLLGARSELRFRSSDSDLVHGTSPTAA